MLHKDNTFSSIRQNICIFCVPAKNANISRACPKKHEQALKQDFKQILIYPQHHGSMRIDRRSMFTVCLGDIFLAP